MNNEDSMQPIGGYFELELRKGKEYHTDAIRLNTGRNALEYILWKKDYKKIFLPYFTCEVLFESIKKLDVESAFYFVDEKLEPIFELNNLQNDEAFLYTNYFGLKDSFIEELSNKCENLIIDNAQAFFAKPIKGADTFYSARKFFGVPDGAYLYTNTKYNSHFEYENVAQRFEHLIKRIEEGPEEGYATFKKNNNSFKNSSIKRMSKVSRIILEGIDYELVKRKRQENFKFLQKELIDYQQLEFKSGTLEVPLTYPLLYKDKRLKEYLIKHKVYIATYWPNVINNNDVNTQEYKFAQNLIHIPIDQRYSINEMKRITKLIKEYE
jgi:hypothetical protein